MEFSGFLGNAPVKEALSAAFAAGRFPHALLFQGEPGCGKRTFAKLVAQALVCRDKDHAPCGVCPACVRAKAGSHPDIRVVEGSGATRSLSVDQVKEITSDAYRAPEEADVSVYLLFLGSRAMEPAQNKLLKLIESPGTRCVYFGVPVSGAVAAHHPQPCPELSPPASQFGGGCRLCGRPGKRPGGKGTGAVPSVRREYRPDAPGALRRRGKRKPLPSPRPWLRGF